MTRQVLIQEINRLEIEFKEKIENILNEAYIHQKYPILKLLFEQSKGPQERWSQLVREVLIADPRNIQYMYDRTILLARRIGSNQQYFKIKTEFGTFTLPDRLSHFNKLVELHSELFIGILPGLLQKLYIEQVPIEEKKSIISGPVNWHKTIVDKQNTGLPAPQIFTVSSYSTRFNTPENVLILLSILRMRQDALFLLTSNVSSPLSQSEVKLLGQIVDRCGVCTTLPIFQDILSETVQYVDLNLNAHIILTLEAKVKSRLKEYSPLNSLMKDLLTWRIKYRELYVRVGSAFSTRYPIDHLKDFDTAYEVWILLELIDFLKMNGYSINLREFPTHTQISKDGLTFIIHYQERYPGWSSAVATPDYTIESEGRLIAILDAKNWLTEEKTEAIYKMLGYMNNLDIPIGILFFPNTCKLKEIRLFKPDNPKNIGNCYLFNCVLAPSPDLNCQTGNQSNIQKLFSLIEGSTFTDFQI